MTAVLPGDALRPPVPATPPAGRPGAGRGRPGRTAAPTRPTVTVVSGIVWAAVLLVTVAGSAPALAVVLAPVVVLAVATGWRARCRTGGPAPSAAAVLPGAVLVAAAPLAALAGAPAAGALLVVGGVAVAAGSRRAGAGGPMAAVLAAAPGLGAAALVVAARQGDQIAVVLVAAVCAFDMANAVMGTGPTGGVAGAAAGAVTVAVLAVAVHSTLVPPFGPLSSWVLCAAVAVCAPLGVALCWRLAPGRAPALRRLDSLVLAAPVWDVVVVVALHR